MKFWQFLRFAPPEMLPRLAQVAEDAGFHGVMLVDHMFVPEQFDTTGTLYSTGQDGTPFWDEEDPWPDPWAAIGAMAAVTSATAVFHLHLHPAAAQPVRRGQVLGDPVGDVRQPGGAGVRRGLDEGGVRRPGHRLRHPRPTLHRDDRSDAAPVA